MNGECGNIKFTDEQQKCIDYSGDELLVKGIAGSGKTLVLLKRAIKTKEKARREGRDIKIGFVTFTKTLSEYSKHIVNETNINAEDLNVRTFHSCAFGLLNHLKRKKIIENKHHLYDEQKRTFISDAINKQIQKRGTSHRLYDIDNKFWEDEIKWIKGKRIKSKEEYINAKRRGRGSHVRMSDKDKEVAFDLYQQYEDVLRIKNKIEYDDFSNVVLDNIDSICDDEKFDYIFVDEAQDLSFSQLLLLKKITKVGITIAADDAQKIYKTSFSWKDLGINVRGKGSKSLSENFRSTKQVVNLAKSLISHNKSNKGLENEYVEAQIPKEEGPIPSIIQCKSTIEEDMFLGDLIQKLDKEKDVVIGLLYRTWKEKNKITSILKSNRISYENIDKKSQWNLLNPGCKVISMHSAKGLEFDVVIIPRLNKGVIPIEVSKSEEDDLTELLESERSLLYVAMTRAKKVLYMTCSGEHSQFIDELDKDLYEPKEY